MRPHTRAAIGLLNVETQAAWSFLAVIALSALLACGGHSGAPPPAIPPLTPIVTAPATVTADAAGLTASVPAQVGAAYVWSLSAGAITAGQGTTTIAWSAPDSGTVLISCTASNAGGTVTGFATCTAIALAISQTETTPNFVAASGGQQSVPGTGIANGAVVGEVVPAIVSSSADGSIRVQAGFAPPLPASK